MIFLDSVDKSGSALYKRILKRSSSETGSLSWPTSPENVSLSGHSSGSLWARTYRSFMEHVAGAFLRMRCITQEACYAWKV